MASSAGLVSLSPSSSPLLSPRPSSSPSSFSFPSLPSPRSSLASSPRSTINSFFLDLEPPSSSSFLPSSNSFSRSRSRSPSPSPSLPSTPRSPPFRVFSYARSFTSTEPQTDRFASPSLAGPIRKTHYSILGVPPHASSKEIRVAYRRLALLHHPDVSPLHLLDTATKLFSEINEAYSTLADPLKRASYDLKLALESPVTVGAMYATSPREYKDSSTGRVYPSMNSFYREWRQARN